MPNINPCQAARPASRAAAQVPVPTAIITSPSTKQTTQVQVEQAPVAQGQTVNP